MSNINTDYLNTCIKTLEKSYIMLNKSQEDSVDYELFRNSLVKSFEMTLEQCGKLLKKKIEPYFATKKSADKLTFKDIFRHAHKYSLITEEETKRWLKYRDNRNNTVHDYGESFANETLVLISDFLIDAKNLREIIDND